MREPQHVIDAGHIMITLRRTVDGGNPASQLIGSLSQYLHGFSHPRWCSISFISSMSTKSFRNPFSSIGIVLVVELILLRKERDSPTRCLEMGFHPRQSLLINYWLTLYGGLKLSRSKPRELLQIGLIEKFSKESLPTFGLLLCCVAQESQTLN